MAKTRFIQSSFTSGVLSPLLKGRTDLEQYYQGAETIKNFVLLPQGGIRRRPGTEFIDKALPLLTRNTTVPTMPEGGTAANINDDSDSTTAVTTTNISTVDPYVVAKYDLGVATYIEVADVRGIFLTSLTSVDEFRIQYSDDDVTYTDAFFLPLIGTEPQDFRLAVQGEYRYWRLVKIGGTDLGTDKVTLAEFNLWEKQTTLSEVKLKDFSIESDKHYLLVFTEGNCRIYLKSHSYHVADIKVPYLSSEVSELRDTQSESVMLLFHEDHAPLRIINQGTSKNWAIDTVPFSNVPQFDYNDTDSPTPTNDVQVLTFTGFVAGDDFQIDIESVLSKNITFAGDTTASERSSTAYNIQKNIQEMPVVGESGVSVASGGSGVYTITIGGESAKAFELFSGYATSGTGTKTMAFSHTATGSPRKEDVWSALRGWPKTSCFYGGRLTIGGTKSKPQSLFMSRAGIAFDFDIAEGDDDKAIFTTISSRKLNNIVDVFPGRTLQIFTDGSEFTIDTSPITPATITVTPQTSKGSLNLEAQEIDGATIFADRNGKSIKEYLYSFQESAYVTRDISVLSPELIKSPVDIAILGGTASDDANWVFIVNDDGSATVLNTLRSQDINGFTEWTTSGFINDVAVVDDNLYMVNTRTIGGVESKFIERWSFDHYVDCGLSLTNKIPGPTDEIDGIDHLEGETVKVSAIDRLNISNVIVLDDRVVTGGKIYMEENEEQYIAVQVGLEYIPELKPMPINTNIGSGNNAMRLKKIIRMNIRVKDTIGLTVEGEPLPVRSFGEASETPLDNYISGETGIIDDVLSTMGWIRDDMPIFTVPDQTPCTILNIEYEVESS